MDSRIVAVDHVHLEASRDALDQLTWFYGELAQLDAVEDGAAGDELCFRSARLELRVRLVDTPRGESVACRVTILVDRLEDVRAQLDERRVPYEPLTSTVWTDQRIGLLDPGGNRVEFKQRWPYAPL